MFPLINSRRLYLAQLPMQIYIPPELDDAIRAFTTQGLQAAPDSVEVNCLICYDGSKFFLKNKALGGRHNSTTDHAGENAVGMYHSHPSGGPLHAGDFRQMLERDRRTENFTMVDAVGDRRSALFKTIDSPTFFSADIDTGLRNIRNKRPATSDYRKDLVAETIEIARCASMGYYEGRGRVLYRVHPAEGYNKSSPPAHRSGR